MRPAIPRLCGFRRIMATEEPLSCRASLIQFKYRGKKGMTKKTLKQWHAKEFEDVDKSEFNRIPASTSTYRANCDDDWDAGFKFTFKGIATGQSAFHHIICIHSIQNEHIEPNDKMDFFRKCMVLTDWDINDGHNLISLPTKDVFYRSDLKGLNPRQLVFFFIHEMDAQMGKFGTVPDLPCHTNDNDAHEEYRKAVIKHLKKNVWEPLAEGKKLKECQKADGKSIEAELKEVSDHWRKFLNDRGRQHGGAAYCWRNRHDKKVENVWYIPLSMDPGVPPKRLPPPDWRKVGKNLKSWLKNIFKHV